jgi:hypothetical protein
LPSFQVDTLRHELEVSRLGLGLHPVAEPVGEDVSDELAEPLLVTVERLAELVIEFVAAEEMLDELSVLLDEVLLLYCNEKEV